MHNNDAPEQCVILIGGLGTRLGAITATSPKPLLPVGGKPFLDELVYHVRRFGFRKLLLLAGYRADVVADYVAARTGDRDLEIDVIVEPSPLGTGGALKFAADRLNAQFMLLNGDSLFDFNWLDMVALQHRESATLAMALRLQQDCSRFGVVELSDSRVTGFKDRGGPSPGLINGGVYSVLRNIVPWLPDNGSLEREVLPALAAAGTLAGRTYSGFFIDIGVPDSYAAAGDLIAANRRRPAVIFSGALLLSHRDGTSNHAQDFAWRPGAVAAIKRGNDSGRYVFAYGGHDPAAYDLVARERASLRRVGAHLDDIRPLSGPSEPSIEAVGDLLMRWPVERARSLLVSDVEDDVIAAEKAGLAGRLVKPDAFEATLTDYRPESDEVATR